MTTIKSYTDLGQSKKLAEILPLESADMYYKAGNETQPTFKLHSYGHIMSDKDIRAWSLAALLEVLKNKIVYGGNDSKSWFVSYTKKNPTKTIFIYKEHLIDACYEAILNLSYT